MISEYFHIISKVNGSVGSIAGGFEERKKRLKKKKLVVGCSRN